jgi:hypothetical protein
MTVPNFLKQKVATNAEKMKDDSALAPVLLTGAGIESPNVNGFTIDDKTTYKDLFMAKYNEMKPDFPTKSLFENTCLAFCPDGYASVNGICLSCRSPC